MKKAFLVGINSYPPPASKLKAPLREVKKWAKLLRDRHGFDSVVVPEKETLATRQYVLDGLRDLFRGATSEDHLVFGFFGHGAEANGWETDTVPNQDREHALVVYTPAVGKQGFQHATITPSDIARLLDEPDLEMGGAYFTMILDTCFAEKFGIGDGGRQQQDISTGIEESNPVALFIPNAVPGLRKEEASTFGDVMRMMDSAVVEPLIVAASRLDERAVEEGPKEDRRLLFSRKAIVRLGDAANSSTPISTRELIDQINPLSAYQSAAIVGNTDAEADHFAGGLGPPTNSPSLPSKASEPAEVASAAGVLHIRFLGLATLINGDGDPYRHRMVFPYDYWSPTPDEQHFGFIEVPSADLRHQSTGTLPYEYVRGGVSYSRWTLTEHRVQISNVADNGQPIWRSPAFEYHVPSLPVVTPELTDPRPECLDPHPRKDLFSAFIELQTGNFHIGELENKPTIFKGQVSQEPPTWGPRQTPISVLLEIPLTQEFTAITITDKDDGITAFYVRSGATILAGNAREADINGPGSGDGPPEHFLICYNLATPPVYDPGLPDKDLVPTNACTVTTWP